ncbi:unnamed protein product, partial [Mesorhabditis spiculigera]
MSLPSYQSATSTTPVSHTSLPAAMAPPPPYFAPPNETFELHRLQRPTTIVRPRPGSPGMDPRLEQRLLSQA